MARKFLYFVAFCIVLYIGGRLALQFYPEQLTRISFTPGGKFEPQPALAANAYDDPAMWLVRPGASGENLAAWRPDGDKSGPTPLRAAVFYVHPTTYLKKTHWNAPLDDPDANRIATIITRTQVSVFGGSQQIWAPNYRQATFGAFITDKPEGRQALDLAYRDVAEAFDAFVAAAPKDLPIVLAGHSQGSFHLKRLLAEKVRGTPLTRRIAAVYAIGWLVDADTDLAAMGLPACAGPEQSGCVISYLSFTAAADPGMMRRAYQRYAGKAGVKAGARFLCSNPLTGGIGGIAMANANLGATVPDLKMEHARLAPALVGAACAPDGTLRIGAGPDMGPLVLPGGNYHVYDYALFWANLRADVGRRVAAWRP